MDIPSSLGQRSWAEIDLDAFTHNVRLAKAAVPGCDVLAVLKADGYGHGAVPLALSAVEAGAVMVGVGDSTEALELRAAGVAVPILVLGALVSSEMGRVVREDVTPVAHSASRLAEIEAAAAAAGKRGFGVHLKVDTGMGRLGVSPSKLVDLAERIAASSWLRLDGVMSHLAGGPDNETQMERFRDALAALRGRGIAPRWVHVRSSTGLELPRLADLDENLVRVGASLYGFVPHGGETLVGARPVLSLRTQLVFYKDLEPGQTVGYGATFRTRRPTRIGIIPLGYYDGMPPRLANRGEVLLRGRRARVIGEVSMDYTTLDITDVPEARVSDPVTIIGSDGGASQTVEQVAAAAETSAYAVLCGIGRRVVRVPVWA